MLNSLTVHPVLSALSPMPRFSKIWNSFLLWSKPWCGPWKRLAPPKNEIDVSLAPVKTRRQQKNLSSESHRNEATKQITGPRPSWKTLWEGEPGRLQRVMEAVFVPPHGTHLINCRGGQLGGSQLVLQPASSSGRLEIPNLEGEPTTPCLMEWSANPDWEILSHI